jgi:hypothetical protein
MHIDDPLQLKTSPYHCQEHPLDHHQGAVPTPISKPPARHQVLLINGSTPRLLLHESGARGIIFGSLAAEVVAVFRNEADCGTVCFQRRRAI